MGLTQKILLFTSLLVVALVATSVGYTTIQADRLARGTIDQALEETKGVWDAFQADRYNKLKLGVRALSNDPFFKALIEAQDEATIGDTLAERGVDIKADFFVATDPWGVVLARSDRPGAAGEDLSEDPIVMEPLDGFEAATVWRQGDRLYHAVAVPMITTGELKGVLVAGYAINEALANEIRKLTHSEIAFLSHPAGGPTLLSVSSLGPKQQPFWTALQTRPDLAQGGGGQPFELDVGGDVHVAVQVPLEAASGETVASVVALRSLAQEKAEFTQFRNSLVLVSLVVMALGLGVAYVAASRITGPVRRLAASVERARDGRFTGAVEVQSHDEIGVLARAFNSLLADLREKQQMIEFLREGMATMVGKGRAAAGAAGAESAEATAAMEAVTTPSVRLEPGGKLGGRYEILATVGKGGMGVVYRARDEQLDEEVALKVLRTDVLQEDPTLLERFKQEIKLARRITHRNVLRTHDFGDADGTPYISMEYLEGVTLKDLVKSKGALPLGVGLSVAKQMCLGLEAAHHQGVVHRDIKPQNMLILPESGDLKIMDFGIARVSSMKGGEGGLTTTGTVMGTPDYMPPEQAQGEPADFRSDIYSLGVVLYEIFCGQLPFKGETVMAVVLSHIQNPPPPPRSVNPHLPEKLERIILRCLDKDPARRYQQVEELLADLSAASSESGAKAS